MMYKSYKPLPACPSPATECPCQSNPGTTESKMEIEVMDLVEAFYLINLLEQERLLQRISLLRDEDALHVPDNEWIADCLPSLVTLCRILLKKYICVKTTWQFQAVAAASSFVFPRLCSDTSPSPAISHK